jgi:hypothetical protein
MGRLLKPTPLMKSEPGHKKKCLKLAIQLLWLGADSETCEGILIRAALYRAEASLAFIEHWERMENVKQTKS